MRDERGAILVMAVFMAAFLVGCLWYLIGVGDAALYRQKVQDGSDAVAYASAVYHARGMNIIAVLNLIMAAILAVYIALKIADMIAIIVAAVAGAICAFGGFAACPVEAAAQAVDQSLQVTIKQYKAFMDPALTALSKAQVTIATITPWIGSARAVMASEEYKPMVKGGFAISVSMAPSGKRLGLPVEEEPYEKLCERAGKFAGQLVTAWLPGPFQAFVGNAVGALVGTFPGYFCDGGGGTVGTVDDAVAAMKANCAKLPDKKKKKQCEKDAEDQEFKDKFKAQNGDSFDSNGKTSKKVFEPARNGDDYFQVYGFVLGDVSGMKERGEKGTAIAAWGKQPADTWAAIEPIEQTGFAEAEFYYDQVDAGKLNWDDYKDDAMWNMRWRARLRRFRLPSKGDSAGLLAGGLPSGPSIPDKYKGGGLDVLAKGIDGIVGSNFIASWLVSGVPKDDAAMAAFVGNLGDSPVIH